MGDPRILVLRGGALGDFVLTLPALALLREQWPASHIELVGYPHIARLAQIGGLVNEVHSLDAARIATLFSWKPTIPSELVAYLSAFDIVISYLYDPDGTVQSNMKTAGVRRYIYGNPRVIGMHAADFLVRPLESLAIYSSVKAVPLLAVRADCRQAGFDRLRAFGSQVAILHPGSGGMKKRWPLTGFLELAKRLKEDGRITPLLMLGEADQDLMDALNALGKPWPMLFGLSLCDVAGVLSCASLYVGNDSGVTHLAAAVGVRTVALFGPSDPAIWGPRGSHVSVCRPERTDRVDMESLTPCDVWNKITKEQR